MKTHKFVQDLNIDGVSIKITSDGANSIAGTATPETPMLEPQLVFGDKEVTIGSMFTNGGQEISLVFREIKNGNDRFAVCTGFKYGADWYLDRPDDGEFIDPLDNMAKKQVVNGKITTAAGSTDTSAPTDIEEEPAQPPAEPEREKFASYEEFFEWAKAEAAKLKSPMCGTYTFTKLVGETKGSDRYSVKFEDACQDQIGGSIHYSVVAPFYKNTVRRNQIAGIAT